MACSWARCMIAGEAGSVVSGRKSMLPSDTRLTDRPARPRLVGQPLVTIPLFYLAAGSWARAFTIGALLWVGCTLVGSLLISMFAIRPDRKVAEPAPEEPTGPSPKPPQESS